MSSNFLHVIACVKIFFLFQAEYNSIGWICYQKVRFLGLAACHPKAIKQARLVEGKVCFISPATGEGEGRHLSKGWLPALATSEARAFINRRRELHAEIAQLSVTVILKLAIHGLTSIILVVLGTVNLQFQDPFSPFLWGQFSELWQLLSWVLSGHHALKFSTWCFSIYKTALRMWLRILSIAREKELKVFDYV